MAGITFIDQSMLKKTTVYDDGLAVENAMDAVTLEDDLNYIRSQLRNIVGQDEWCHSIPGYSSLTTLNEQKLLYWTQTTTDIVVPYGQNYVTLSGAGKPSGLIAAAPDSTGAVVAQLTGPIGSHSTDATTNEGNLVSIRDADTNLSIFSGDQQIFGFLQVGSTATDGCAFSDSGDNQGQISFVVRDPIGEGWAAAPVPTIQDKTIEYAYTTRASIDNVPEHAFRTQLPAGGGGSASYDVEAAYDSSNLNLMYTGTAVTGSATSSAVWRISRFNMASNNLQYADGNQNYDNVWDDRESLSYS